MNFGIKRKIYTFFFTKQKGDRSSKSKKNTFEIMEKKNPNKQEV